MHMVALSDQRGKLSYNEPMARHCSWKAGGHADVYFEPADKEDLALFLNSLINNEAVTWLGLGSNLLVRDGGIRGVVISVLNRLNTLKLLNNGIVYAECGVTCAKLARFCRQQGLAEADFLAGIPGTIGGALAMNAGAFGFETWDYVDSVEMMSRQGELIRRKAGEFQVSYRSVGKMDDEWFAAGYFQFPAAKGGKVSNIKPLLERRNATQPIGLPSCGSVFKNPDGDHAARLIEACGLKGYCIGGACVSDKHANFIINTKHAKAADIEALIRHIQQTVRDQFGIELRTEVRIIGEHE
jgi:UDP-N-acetylmuramate dehydrogenase